MLLCDFFLTSVPLSFQYSYINNFWIHYCLIFTLSYIINYLQLSIVVYYDSFWWTFCFFLKLIFGSFLCLLYFLCGCYSAVLIGVWQPPPQQKPWFVLFAFVCIVFDFSFQITSVRSLNKLLGKDAYSWFSAISNFLIPANGPHWDFKIKFSSSSVTFFKIILSHQRTYWISSFELWMFQ